MYTLYGGREEERDRSKDGYYAIWILHRQQIIFVHVAKQPPHPSHDGQQSQFNFGILHSLQQSLHIDEHEHDGHLQSSQQLQLPALHCGNVHPGNASSIH
jgi:hypothetical protein